MYLERARFKGQTLKTKPKQALITIKKTRGLKVARDTQTGMP
jgi:hypothetical protein